MIWTPALVQNRTAVRSNRSAPFPIAVRRSKEAIAHPSFFFPAFFATAHRLFAAAASRARASGENVRVRFFAVAGPATPAFRRAQYFRMPADIARLAAADIVRRVFPGKDAPKPVA